jgi:catechol 2,3-dioxygenase
MAPADESLLRHPNALNFSHLGFYVQDQARMSRYYKDVLCFTETDQGDLGPVRLVFLSRNPAEHHQIVLISGRPENLGFNIINQISLRVPDLATLREVRRRAAADPGTTELLCATHGNAVSIYFRDPEGNRLEIFMDTPWYCEQPLARTDRTEPDRRRHPGPRRSDCPQPPQVPVRERSGMAEMAACMGYSEGEKA